MPIRKRFAGGSSAQAGHPIPAKNPKKRAAGSQRACMRFPQKWFSAQDHLFGRHCHEAADSPPVLLALCVSGEKIRRIQPSSAQVRPVMLDQQLTRGMADRLNAHAVYADDEGTVDPSAATEALVPGAHRAGGQFWPTCTVPPPRSRVARVTRLLCVQEPRGRNGGDRYRAAVAPRARPIW